jgi:hypothetical protein
MLMVLTAAAIPLGIAHAAGSSAPGDSVAGGFAIGGLTAVAQIVPTARGPAIVTGNFGAVQTTTLPGAAGQGIMINNGNGTSTLIGQGGMTTTVPTPRS